MSTGHNITYRTQRVLRVLIGVFVIVLSLVGLVLLASPAAAQDAQLVRVQRLLPRGIANWQINVVNEANWSQAVRQYDVADKTRTAVTLFKQRYTVIRRLRLLEMTDGDVRDLLAHEAGHIVCQCSDESRAEKSKP